MTPAERYASWAEERGAVDAAAELRLRGFPAPKDEAWKYTRAERFVRDLPEPEGKGKGKGKGLLGQGGFVALNEAFGELQVVSVAAGDDRTLRLEHQARPGVLSAPRLRLEVGEDARVVLVEAYGGAGGLTVAGTELVLGPGASVHYLRVTEDPLHVGLVGASLADRAHLRLTSVAASDLARIELRARTDGQATAELAGLALVRGEQHVDHHVLVDHAAPGGTSRQDFRSLLDERGRSVFTGKVVVRKGAQKTDSAQMHRALLLSDRAIATARPQLEILADDVKCAHGTAVGSLDPEALFYLRQRGLDPAQARALLTVAFASQILDTVPEAERPALEARVARWLEGA